ncbi:fucose 4-O-acetylase-like acetyltransferase [Halanaerobium saccharolyticum]|uniref:Fucose 4-O-acetylase-like acetyltransferase n=1 Tax=Halanaerobium saccharolyticum TaxID=43595 RepID=A0A4R7ZC92_9FIRM|nr:acyltransferase family protein [Halanaerobium saccharolyticum]RAK09327.1 fucose 4-O-acetylase-like acetyltransferase [Halanaerobium saccharolyticum]TDW06186.1 fucose 4-O-acetylase-like acetyltransferase [Halanaerobium saccharolyticum]TDX60980.1 fucose 4-O-acetylase-like acetyltransferase [Halanaerobium saccharolyticum]
MAEKRLYFFDNAKFILITLVLIGHFFEPLLQENTLAEVLYIFIYSFHMPAFIFIAGYFSNVNVEFKYYLIKNIKRLLIPYFIFQFLYLAFNSLLNNYSLILNFKRPFWILWFLLSLFFWRVLIFIIEKFKIPAVFTFLAAVAAALLIGFTAEFGRIFSGSRTVVFFPFFILGYYFKKYSIAVRYKNLDNYISRKLMFFIYTAELIFIYLFLNNLNLEILYGAVSYFRLGSGLSQALLNRFLFLNAALINLFLFFKIIPAQRTLISSRGARSIYPFLLHGFIIIILDKFDLFYFLNPGFSLFVNLFLALFFSWFLSSQKIRNIFKYILEF